jgi:hypothetical protein
VTRLTATAVSVAGVIHAACTLARYLGSLADVLLEPGEQVAQRLFILAAETGP